MCTVGCFTLRVNSRSVKRCPGTRRDTVSLTRANGHGLTWCTVQVVVITFFTCRVSMGAAMFWLGWMSSAVLYWVVSRFLAILFERRYHPYNRRTGLYHSSRERSIQGPESGNLSMPLLCGPWGYRLVLFTHTSSVSLSLGTRSSSSFPTSHWHVTTFFHIISYGVSCPRGLNFAWWGCYGLCQRHQPTKLAHSVYSVLVSLSVYVALSTVFHSMNSPDSDRHSVFSLCSSCFISYFCLFMKVSFRLDIIPG